jgi:hypothetical protein
MNRITVLAALILSLAALVGWTGCNGGAAAIPPVKVNFERVVEQLLTDYDVDKNLALSKSELDAHPAVAECLSRCRRDRGDEISADQLERFLQAIFDPRAALVGASCVVRRNGQPLSGAEVRFVPLPAFEGVLPTGSGVSDSYGAAMITPPREALPEEAPAAPGLMPPGLYLVEVSHPSVTIPEKYNRNTVLGKEVSSETVYRGALAVNLKH